MKRLVVLTAVAGLLAAASVNAGPILGCDSAGSGAFLNNTFGSTVSIGWSFTTGPSAVQVTALDAIFTNGQTSAGVRLYDASATTLASATVTTSDPTETNGLTWNSHSITPITLSANTEYFIAEDLAVGAAAYRTTLNLTMELGATYGGGVSSLSGGSNPTGDPIAPFPGALNPSYFGPNFDAATATPEPASLTFLGLGVAGLAGYGWRRRKRTEA